MPPIAPVLISGEAGIDVDELDVFAACRTGAVFSCAAGTQAGASLEPLRSACGFDEKDVHVFLAGGAPIRVFVEKGLVDRGSDALVIDMSERSIEHLISDLQSHPRVAQYVLVPGSLVRESAPATIGGEQVKVAVIHRTPYRDRVWNPVAGIGLQVYFTVLVGEIPVGYGRSDKFSGNPESRTPIARFEPEYLQ